ncbi:MAG: cadmium-translocating P-type ATPase [Clostridiales bacterium]|nr:cadmium-translocating P-type ATPase [Clostridiales bacterium]MBS5878004.1 cadmium-translocating P-type ATPase [Clostridiales bacterium]MDU0939898.1 heavy metal translocating P-type ATPase [Clostridiales bacterium]MDU1042420.1 heavy metal translocating P-type ATPase [Clostridiales bacterium]
MTKSQKRELTKIIVGGCLFAVIIILEHTGLLPAMPNTGYNWLGLSLFMVPYIIVAHGVIATAGHNIKNGRFFDENLLMVIATCGAFVVGEFSEGVAVMLFYLVGEFFQDYAVNRSRQSIKELMDIMPEYANIEEDGSIVQVDPDDVEIGTTIIVKPGEKIPLDGIVTKGETMVDTSSLTGESVPRSVKEGDEVISGCVNRSTVIYVKTTRDYDNSTVSKILELVENAGSKKAKTEKFITKFAKYYTPIVVFAALALFIIPSLVTKDWYEWLTRACNFLVVSCPCALVISVPLGFFGGIGAASRAGILIKGGNYLEAAAKLDTIVFDKTGTLTKGIFKITELNTATDISENDLLKAAAIAEHMSNHPIAVSIRNEFSERGGQIDLSLLSDNEEVSGHGMEAVYNGDRIFVGNAKLMQRNGVEFEEHKTAGTVCYVAVNDTYYGNIVISDVIKEEAIEAIKDLKAMGVSDTVMLTGDRKIAGEAVAAEVGIDTVYTDLLPADKVEKVEELLEKKPKDKVLAFVGDGINDTPVLARSDIGFAMGGIGSDAAIEAADIVIMDDDIRKIGKTVKISRFALKVIRQNIFFALAVKLLIIVLSSLGLVNMWIAVFGDVGVAIICIINSMRILSLGKNRKNK